MKLYVKQFVLLLAAVSGALAFQAPAACELARWQQQAANVNIVRDDWGIAHVYGKSDADAVFGTMLTLAACCCQRASSHAAGAWKASAPDTAASRRTNCLT